MSLTKFWEYAEKRYEYWNRINKERLQGQIFYVSAFERPLHPAVVILEGKPEILPLKWGLIPFWVKDYSQGVKISSGTFNAVGETVFEKPSFRTPIKERRCLIPVTGFFEWHENNKKKYPFIIRLKNEEPFSLAGIWDRWTDRETKEEIMSFSIVTTNANPLLEKIHNTKKRMPVILKYGDEKKWLANEPDIEEIKKFIVPYPESELEAYPVSNLISRKGIPHNVPEVLEKFEYDELKDLL
jgi:putative SOS response-associated peptidase YedK